MKKNEMTWQVMLIEAVGIVSAIAYLGLQIYYGIAFHVNPVNLMMNLVFMILVYVGLTLLAVYPERVNGLTREVCSGKIRQYTLRMVRMVKLVFVEGLLFTSVCDALGKELKQGYSLIIVVLIAAIAVYFEGGIINIRKQNNKKKKGICNDKGYDGRSDTASSGRFYNSTCSRKSVSAFLQCGRQYDCRKICGGDGACRGRYEQSADDACDSVYQWHVHGSRRSDGNALRRKGL